MRTAILTLMLALVATLAPLAAAQDDVKEEEPTRPDDAAWVEDCPPDMMCAAGADDPQAYGDEDCIECSGPVDEGSTQNDGGAEPGQALGPEDCIECMQPPREETNGETCMDGAQEGEDCRDDVQYLGPAPEEPTRGPSDGSCEYCRGDDGEEPVVATPISAPVDDAETETQGAAKNDVPAAGLGAILAAFAAAAVLVIRKL